MRTFLIGDVHGNLEALESVFADMKKHYTPSFFDVPKNGTDRLGNLGDLVGYMPNPNEVMDRVFPLADFNIPGNHDIWALDGDLNDFNPTAAEALIWTRETLTDVNKERLKSIMGDDKYVFRDGNLIFTHSNPKYPKLMRYYITDASLAFDLFFNCSSMKGLTAFVGHSHKPQLYYLPVGKELTYDENLDRGKVKCDLSDKRKVETFELGPFESSLVVIPSVGQPRDGCPLAGYAVYFDDEKEVDFVRVPYDVLKTQRKIKDSSLPEYLASRLAIGR